MSVTGSGALHTKLGVAELGSLNELEAALQRERRGAAICVVPGAGQRHGKPTATSGGIGRDTIDHRYHVDRAVDHHATGSRRFMAGESGPAPCSLRAPSRRRPDSRCSSRCRLRSSR